MSKRVNVMELFQRARDQHSEKPSEPLEERASGWIDVLEDVDNRLSPLGVLEPNFLSESCLLAFGNACGVVGNNLFCVGFESSLCVIDMCSGLRSDPSLETALRPLVDLAYSATSNIVLYTDGIDVGLVKCTQTSTGVHLNGCVYLKDVGTVADPVCWVRFHGGPNFVTVRSSSGWTVWDTARLIMKAVPLLHADPSRVPALFRSAITTDAGSLAEEFVPWKKASNILAGKKLSPGVLSILKRADVPTPIGGKCDLFEFSADGKFAIAFLDSGLVVWSIGPKCATIDLVTREIAQQGTFGKKIATCVVTNDSNFTLITKDAEILQINVEKDELVGLMRFSGASSTGAACKFKNLAGDIVLAVGLDTSQILLICGSQMFQIACEISPIKLAIGPSSATEYSLNLFIGTGTEWHSQTLELGALFGAPQDESRDDFERELQDYEAQEYEAEDEEAQEVMAKNIQAEVEFNSEVRQDEEAPERLESTFMQRTQVAELTEKIAQLEATNKMISENLFAEMKAKIERLVGAQVREAVDDNMRKLEQSTKTTIEAERQLLIKNVGKVISGEFARAMKSMFGEIAGQIEAKFAALDNSSLEKRLDALLSGPSPQIVIQVENLVGQNRLMDAVSAIMHWYKANQPNSGDNLVPRCCAYIANGAPVTIDDASVGCFNLLVLTEWIKSNQAAPAPVVGAGQFLTRSLMASNLTSVNGEMRELCVKSLSKAIRNVINMEVLVDEIRGVMVKLGSSRANTPRASPMEPINEKRGSNVQGSSILQMLQRR